MGSTLYQQWQARYDRLERDQQSSPYVPVLLKLFHYLLTRYRGTPEAELPAVGPADLPLWVNERTMVVHQHLLYGQVGGVRNQADADLRIAGVLGRMQAAGVGEPPMTLLDERGKRPRLVQLAAGMVQLLRSAWSEPSLRDRWHRLADEMERAIAAGHDPLEPVEAAHGRREILPESALCPLYACASDDDCEPTLLARSRRLVVELTEARDRSVPYELLLEWHTQLPPEPLGPNYPATEACFFEHPWPSIEMLRHELAHSDPRVRLRATVLLSHTGSLHDIHLLGDLLLLPVADDEAPGERPALADGLQRLARRLTGAA